MQGFNMGRYVPPEFEGTTSANKLAGKHALGARARKSGQGILTVRFEMPFAIWCSTCPKPTIIGQGVRFNAEKKRVGNYHTTPIYSFRMKHVACGGAIEIRTDPKNTAYVVTEGATKRDTGEDKVQEGEIRVAATAEERERLERDAFAALEGKVEDRRQAASDKGRIEELQRAKERDWEDPGEANRRLRRAFRVERKIREEKEGATEALKDRMSLGMDLLEETEEDRLRAGFVEFGDVGVDGDIVKAKGRPLFADSSTSKKALSKQIKSTKAALKAERRKESLRAELGENTRAVLDPFLNVNGPNRLSKGGPPILKRKTKDALVRQTPSNVGETENDVTENDVRPSILVDYDSD